MFRYGAISTYFVVLMNKGYQKFRVPVEGKDSLYSNLFNITTEGLKDFYDLSMQIGVYSAGIAFVIAAIVFFTVKTSNPQEYADAKWRLIKTAIIVALLFSVVSAIAFVQAMGMG